MANTFTQIYIQIVFSVKQRASSIRPEWQERYGAFSCSHSQIGDVIEYVRNQQEHHRKTMFREEYIEFLKGFNVPYDPKYVFDVEE